MQVDISYNEDKNGIELLFSEKLSKNLSTYLKDVGFKETYKQPLKWTATRTPAYVKYGNDLKDVLSEGKSFQEVVIYPSYPPSEENIDHNKFSYVTITFLKEEDEGQESFIVFDPYKRVAQQIGKRYAIQKHGEAFKGIDVSPRNYKRKARTLLKEEKFVTGDEVEINQGTTMPDHKKADSLDKKRKLELLGEFKAFHERRKLEFPKVVVEAHELLIQFTSWLRENYPEHSEQTAEIWKEYPAVQLTEPDKKQPNENVRENPNSSKKEYQQAPEQREPLLDPLTNDHGVYTEQTAGSNFETIKIGIPSTAKVEVEIELAKGTDGLFRHGVNVQKNFGDHSGSGYAPNVHGKTFSSRLDALKSALAEVIDTLNGLHKSEDYILSNDEKKRKLIAKAIAALLEYSNAVFETDHKPAKSSPIAKSIALDIESRGVSVPNVLVPALSKEPFISGSIMLSEWQKVHEASPEITSLKDEDLLTASAVTLFELSQMPHPNEYQIEVNRSTLLEEWSKRGKSLFEELGFPTDLNYPYVNRHAGYKSVDTLEDILGESGDKWWSVVEHNRPIADLPKAIQFIESEVKRVDSKRQELLNPKTKKPTGENKEQYKKLTWLIEYFEQSKQIVKDYLSTTSKKKIPKEKAELPSRDTNDYIDKVIAHMHEAYQQGKRVTKGQVEKLALKLKVPNMGKMWEAVELSWLLWYQMLYQTHDPFEQKLAQMIVFWHKVQPTYAYSDSSKEIYKQYSTPCPIAAIVSEYTLMAQAQNIFEPSAGNGLLVLGADPKKTHVNEIDKTRLESLKHQGFKEITHINAAQPFPAEMTKTYDVVVTNPPFARWEEERLERERIVQNYFHHHVGLADKGKLRLEHVMAGLALHTMKDTGKAAIIIMGHIYFDEHGFIAKSRPFFNWLYRHYQVDDVINMNSFKLYNKQGAIEKTMLVLIGGRKQKPNGVAPMQQEAGHLYDMVSSFEELWERVSPHIGYNLATVIKQLKIELGQ
ncbi:MAG: N-6 DNA methylase [Ekhidna sp.]